jgi:hypothetical protein
MERRTKAPEEAGAHLLRSSVVFGRVRRIALLSFPFLLSLAATACEGQLDRKFYNDLTEAGQGADATSGAGDADVDSSIGSDGGEVDGAAIGADAANGDAPGNTTGDGSVDANSDAARDAQSDAAPDAAEAGCGPLDTPTNCGACGRSCDTTHSTSPSCSAGACSYGGCDQGWADCVNAAPDTNGCESPTNTPAHCAGCTACDTATSMGAMCNGTTCSYSGCSFGYANCDKAAPDTNGCETQANTPAHCGGCSPCGTSHATGSTCNNSTTCNYTCATGWQNCNTTAPNTAGCECNTPGCCTSAGGLGTCQTTHTTGLASLNYYDCNPLRSSTTTASELANLALEACTAFTGNVTKCQGSLACMSFPKLGPYVCNGTGASCTYCWAYGGTDLGSTEDCNCPPTTTYGTWN